MRIAVATDLTDASIDAAKYAVIRARRVDADLVVVHVVGSPEIDTRRLVESRYQMTRETGDAKPVVDEFEHRKLEELKEWFTKATGGANGINTSYAIEVGDLPTVLWKIVAEAGADSLVLGAHGTRSVGRHLSRILLAAPIPVVVVRQGIM